MKFLTGEPARHGCMGFNPHRARRPVTSIGARSADLHPPGEGPGSLHDRASPSRFQSSPGPKAGPVRLMSHRRPATRMCWQCGFNPHRARGPVPPSTSSQSSPGPTVRRAGPMSFNPHRARGPVPIPAHVLAKRAGSFNPLGPGPVPRRRIGRQVSTSPAEAVSRYCIGYGVHGFQSSPGPKARCYYA